MIRFKYWNNHIRLWVDCLQCLLFLSCLCGKCHENLLITFSYSTKNVIDTMTKHSVYTFCIVFPLQRNFPDIIQLHFRLFLFIYIKNMKENEGRNKNKIKNWENYIYKEIKYNNKQKATCYNNPLVACNVAKT